MTRSAREVSDCFAQGSDLLPEAEALARLEAVTPLVSSARTVSLGEAIGAYAAETVVAPRPIPAHDNSAVDGYAFRRETTAEAPLAVIGEAFAGRPFEGKVRSGETVRIFTGAVMPTGTDTVAMQEDVLHKDGIVVPGSLKSGANRRRAGEDVAEDEVIVTPGTRLGPADLAEVAAAGFDRLRVHAPLRVAIVSTGDELLEPGTPFVDGRVYDSNKIMLKGLLASYPVEITDVGMIADDRALVTETLKDLCARHDVILTSGGASTGEGDHIVAALEALGSVHFWRIAVKPGRPLALGQIGQCLTVGLPGNPVAVMVCFLLYVRPILMKAGGGPWPKPVAYPLPAAFEMPKKKRDRREYLRGLLVTDQGRLAVDKYARDGSGLIAGLRASQGLIRIGEDVTSIARGDMVEFLPYPELGLLP